MTLVVALAAALCWGISDFCGGLATRRSALLAVLLLSQGIGLVGMAAASLFLGGHPGGGDLLLGAAAGLSGAAGLALLYQSLAEGQMALVSPLTGVVAAGFPVMVGVLLLGERLTPATAAGIAVGIVAVVLLGAGSGTGSRPAPRALAMALGAGAGFAGFYIALDRVAGSAGLWPLVSARAASVTAMLLVAALLHPRLALRGGAPPLLVLAAGVLDVTANALYVVAVHRGLLSIVTVVVSLYPAATVLCALAVLGERLRPLRAAGIAAALVAVGLIASG